MTFPFTQLLVNSLIIGSIYALVASGFSLIYSTNRFMHFAHGSSIVFSGYMLFTLFTQLQIPFLLAAVITIILTSVLGYLMFILIYAPLQKKKSSNVILLIASVALLLLFQNFIQLIFGANVKSIGAVKVQQGIQFLNASITPLQITIIACTLILFIVLQLFMHKTKTGMHLRAVANNKELASIMGLHSKKLMALSFIIGSGLAGMGGMLIGLEQNLTPVMGTDLMIKGFSASVIGGITSVPASIVGSYIIGIAENFGIWYLPSGYTDAITFTLLFLFLLFRPSGLWGIAKGVKA